MPVNKRVTNMLLGPPHFCPPWSLQNQGALYLEIDMQAIHFLNWQTPTNHCSTLAHFGWCILFLIHNSARARWLCLYPPGRRVPVLCLSLSIVWLLCCCPLNSCHPVSICTLQCLEFQMYELNIYIAYFWK